MSKYHEEMADYVDKRRKEEFITIFGAIAIFLLAFCLGYLLNKLFHLLF